MISSETALRIADELGDSSDDDRVVELAKFVVELVSRHDRATAAARGVHVATGAEPWLAGWAMGRSTTLPTHIRALGGDVLHGYVAARIARSQGLPLSDDAALATWTHQPPIPSIPYRRGDPR